MADNKVSSEDKVTTLQCMVCNFREVFTENQFNFTDGYSCYVCDGPVMQMRTKSGEAIINRKVLSTKRKSVGEATEKFDFDCSEALKGLKAIQREARKATQALKELEVQKKSVSLFPDHKCRRCGENKLTLKSLGENIKGVKSVCKDCGARQ